MIARYSRPQMAQLWTEEAKYASWGEVERAHLQTLVDNNDAPATVLDAFTRAFSQKSAADFLRREKETGHDVIAFIAEVGDAMGDEGRFLHRGLTSSDVLDTSLAIRLKNSLQIISSTLFDVRLALARRTFEHASTVCIGRTHGIHAEPMSFGHVLAGHFSEFQRAHLDVLAAAKQVGFGKLSGAVGQYSQLAPDFEEAVLRKLGLEAESVATQVVPRDRVLRVGQALTNIANATERLAVNIRHFARTEVGEVLEPFSQKQKGSSAMPHKKNPILAENLSGLARTIRGYSEMLAENVALWHERDISHSSVERIALPDMFVTLDFMLARLADLVNNMVVRKEVMQKNLERTGGLWASQSVLTSLVEAGMNRTRAYELVQRLCLPLSEQVAFGSLKADALLEQLIKEKSVTELLGESGVRNLFNLDRFLTSTAVVFRRAFGTTADEVNPKAPTSDFVKSVPKLQSYFKVTVELLEDVLDTEAKTVENDFRNNASSELIALRRQKVFVLRFENETSLEKVTSYARDVLCNAVMETVKVEVIQ